MWCRFQHSGASGFNQCTNLFCVITIIVFHSIEQRSVKTFHCYILCFFSFTFFVIEFGDLQLDFFMNACTNFKLISVIFIRV